MKPDRTEGEPHLKWVILLFLLALALRLAAVLLFPMPFPPDGKDYHDLAVALVEGRGFVDGVGTPELFRPPGYPVFMALVYAISGIRPGAVLLAQVVVDLATLGTLWWWARRRLGSTVAVVTLAFAALSLSAIGAVRIHLSESLATLLLVSSIALFDVYRSGKGRVLALSLVACLCALMTLTRANMIFVPLFLAVLMFLEGRPLRRQLPFAFLLLVVYSAGVLPWVVRNYRATGTPMLNTQTGYMVYSYHRLQPGQILGNGAEDEVTRAASAMPPAEAERYYLRETWSSVRSDPWEALAFIPVKLALFFVPLDWGILAERAWNPTYIIVMVFAFMGALRLWRRDRLLVLVAVMPLFYLALLSIPFIGMPRYRLPAEALLTPLAAVGALYLVEWWRSLRKGDQRGLVLEPKRTPTTPTSGSRR